MAAGHDGYTGNTWRECHENGRRTEGSESGVMAFRGIVEERIGAKSASVHDFVVSLARLLHVDNHDTNVPTTGPIDSA